MKSERQDITPLFHAVGLPLTVHVSVNEHTYEVDSAHPQDNWLYPALKGFQIMRDRLVREKKKVRTFATIGTGQGVDAIGAYRLFHPAHIVLTDIHPDVVPVALKNARKNIPHLSCTVRGYVGNLCEPLVQHGVVADIIYANLPNIPLAGSGSAFSGQLTSTFFDERWVAGCTQQLETYLLAVQHAFLVSAHDCLAPGGSVIVTLGGRVPLALVHKMFTDTGYVYQELVNYFKLQSQPEWVLGGYARAEEQHGVSFDFYRFDAAHASLQKHFESASLTAAALKRLLQPFRVSATDALKRFVYHQERIGHVVQVIRGKKQYAVY